jgi:MFS family permease
MQIRLSNKRTKRMLIGLLSSRQYVKLERGLRSLTSDSLRSGLALAGAALAYFVTVGFLNAYGVFQEYYTSDVLRGLSEFQISWLGSFAIFCIFFFAPAAGLLADKFGPTV